MQFQNRPVNLHIGDYLFEKITSEWSNDQQQPVQRRGDTRVGMPYNRAALRYLV
jgi:hypothetical protein